MVILLVRRTVILLPHTQQPVAGIEPGPHDPETSTDPLCHCDETSTDPLLPAVATKNGRLEKW